MKLWGFGALICMSLNQSGTRGRDFCLHKPALLGLRECTFPFYWSLCFCSWSWNTKDETPKTLTGQEWWRAAEHSRAKQGCLAREGPDPRATAQPVLAHNWAVTLLSCSIAMLFSQSCYITVELCALNKVSFTTAQIGGSCWPRISANDYCLSYWIYGDKLLLWKSVLCSGSVTFLSFGIFLCKTELLMVPALLSCYED